MKLPATTPTTLTIGVRAPAFEPEQLQGVKLFSQHSKPRSSNLHAQRPQAAV
jgi:hypothetical protein